MTTPAPQPDPGKIEMADVVRHGPSGEEWLVCRVSDRHLWPAGWPESRADLSDCTLVSKATDADREWMTAQLARLPDSDPRSLSRSQPDLTGRTLADYADALVRSTKDNEPRADERDPFSEDESNV
jgi:hypothetical protein